MDDRMANEWWITDIIMKKKHLNGMRRIEQKINLIWPSEWTKVNQVMSNV